MTVEEVGDRGTRRRFLELPHTLHGADPRFAPLVLAWERWRVDRFRNPVLEEGELALFLARRDGRPIGRVGVLLPWPAAREGAFGLWWCDDDTEAATALLAEARGWLAERGATTMVGPWSPTAEQEAGVLVAGHEAPGLTGRPWHPPHLARLLEAAGAEPAGERRWWRHPLAPPLGAPAPPVRRRPTEAVDPAGPWTDPRLHLPGARAVPDVSELLRAGGWRGLRAAARAARAGTWSVATVVGDPASAAAADAALTDAASAAGYRWLVAPWPRGDQPPEAVHRWYRLTV